VTEQEWLNCTDPTPMLEFLRGKVSERQLRLFACGCVRRIWHLLRVGPSRNAVEVAEKVADNESSDADLKMAYLLAAGEVEDVPHYDATQADPACAVTLEGSWDAAYCVEHVVMAHLRPDWKESRIIHAVLLRDIFNNPFRPVTADPSWLTPTVVALASQMYESRDFSTMPILADALQDAGCDNAEVLAHCRGEGPHVRGCWLIDMLTGRK